MAKTSAERQAAYRAKRAGRNSRERRLNTWVSAKTYATIEQLANRYGVTRRAVIELLTANEDGIFEKLKDGGQLSAGVETLRQVSTLRRNESRQLGAGSKTRKPRQSEKLRRNAENEADGGKRNRRVAKPKPKPDRSSGAQYEFEL